MQPVKQALMLSNFSFTKRNRVAVIEETTKAAQYYTFILD